jgi:hypothetical protein
MARKFNGSSDNLITSATLATLNGTKQIAISFWYWIDSYAATDRLGMELSANYNSNQGAFIFDADASGGGASTYVGVNNAGTITTFNFSSGPSAGKWHHVVFDLDLAQYANVVIYVDGVATSGFSGTGTGTFGNWTLYFMCRGGTSLFLPGRMQDVAFWTGLLLTAADVSALFTGADPRIVRPANLAYYWPIVPEMPVDTNWANTRNTVYLTPAGTTVCPPAPVPRRYRRASLRSWAQPASAPRLMRNYVSTPRFEPALFE